MQTTPHAYGVDDIAFSPTPSKACTPSAWITAPNRSPVPSSVLGAGHFKQALLGQFWVAPKANAQEMWVVKENAHEPIIARELFERVQTILKSKVITIGRTFHRPYLLTGMARCANCGYRIIGHASKGNGHEYRMYTCSAYMRMGKSVCRSVHILGDELEREVLSNIRGHLSSPAWRQQVRDTIRQMVAEEFGDSADHRAEGLTKQLAAVNRQIGNIVDAIKNSGRFSEAMNQTLANLEKQRDNVRADLGEAEKRVDQRIDPDALAQKIIAHFGDFDRVWNSGLALEERKRFLRCYVHQINISHSPSDVQAEIWLYKVPIPQNKMTPEGADLGPFVSRVNCGGRRFILEATPPPEVLPLVIRRAIQLKKPYLHHRKGRAA